MIKKTFILYLLMFLQINIKSSFHEFLATELQKNEPTESTKNSLELESLHNVKLTRNIQNPDHIPYKNLFKDLDLKNANLLTNSALKKIKLITTKIIFHTLNKNIQFKNMLNDAELLNEKILHNLLHTSNGKRCLKKLQEEILNEIDEFKLSKVTSKNKISNTIKKSSQKTF